MRRFAERRSPSPDGRRRRSIATSLAVAFTILSGVVIAGPVAASPTAAMLSIFAGTGIAGTPTAGPATSSNLDSPFGVAVDGAGNVYIADANNMVIEKVTPDGTLSVIAGTGTAGAPTAGPATASNLNRPTGVAVDGAGNVYIADFNNNRVEKVTPGGTLTIIAGTGTWGSPTPGPATSSMLHDPA